MLYNVSVKLEKMRMQNGKLVKLTNYINVQVEAKSPDEARSKAMSQAAKELGPTALGATPWLTSE